MTVLPPLKPLAVFDPELARNLDRALAAAGDSLEDEAAGRIVSDILWSFSQEIHFGQAVSEGYLDLVLACPPEAIARYGNHIRRFGSHGPTQGRMIATHLVPILKTGIPELESRFFDAVAVLLTKGTHLLKEPLEGLDRLVAAPDKTAVSDYLELLIDTFAGPLSYQQSIHLGRRLSRTVQSTPDDRRSERIRAMIRLARVEVDFVEAVLDGMQNGLALLDGPALGRFAEMALERAKTSRESTVQFLSLSSRAAREACKDLQVAVPIGQIQGQLNRYLRARIGRSAAAKPLSSLSSPRPAGPCTDGRTIYLPDEIQHYPRYRENHDLYRSLAKLESGLIEFNTYAFDLGRARALFQEAGLIAPATATPNRSDLEAFFESFPCPGLASDLFTIFEHGRVRRHFDRCYPGLSRTALVPVIAEARRMADAEQPLVHPLMGLYARIGLGRDDVCFAGDRSDAFRLAVRLEERFARMEPERMPVEACAVLTRGGYDDAADLFDQGETEGYPRLNLPFKRALRPDLFFSRHQDLYRRVDRLRQRLKARGVDLYRTELVHRIIDNGGRLSANDVQAVLKPGTQDLESGTMPAGSDLEPVLQEETGDAGTLEDPTRIRWFREWDRHIGDYLHRHTRVRDRTADGGDSTFYDRVLDRHHELVGRIRYAFEMLKPEGLKRLRRWVEGDDFDYRELVDVILDRKAGLMPSDRFYIKRIKQVRDVSVLLLVDLSRSTANAVDDSGTTVLEVEKEAIVLFSQALEVVGDAYAIAGFSGTGRLGVDYYRVKDFGEALSDRVRSRISAMAPQRSTRMGAALRRAYLELASAASRVRLLILLSDGFPNDTGYKRDHAIEDTRKAIAEARTRGISTHGITVNLPGHARLDALYGSVGHTVISDVRDLPDSLLRIYSALTRY